MRLAEWLIERPRWFKRTLLVLNDFALLSFAIWAAYTLRLSRPYWPGSTEMLLLMAAAPVIGVVTFYVRGLYRLVTRFIGLEGSTRIYIAVFIASVLWALAVLMSGIQGNPRSVVVIYGLIAAGLIRLSRQWAASILTKSLPRQTVVSSGERKPVIIYGAGTVGIQLLRALNDTGQYDTVAFIDDTPTLAGQMVHGVKVLRSEKLGKAIADHGVKEVMLALPSTLRSERRLAIKALEPYPVVVKTLPALEEIASGHVEISDLRPIDVEDLLGRDPVAPDSELLAVKVRDKVVMVTGAGGSIGSELTRQLLVLGPKTLVLLELSEVALYEITAEIEDLKRRRRKEAGDRRPRRHDHRRGARLGARPQGGCAHHRRVRRRDHLSRRGLQARTDRRGQSFRGPSKQHLRHADARRNRQGAWREAFRARFDRQGRAPDQRHGREQAPRRTDPAGDGRAARRDNRFHHGALRQRARFVGLGGAPLPQADP